MLGVEIAVLGQIAVLGLLLLAGGWALGPAGRIGALALTLAALAYAATRPAPPEPALIAPSPRPGLAGSDRCAGCHPGAHATWAATYHRTMTQRARPETVLADFDGVELADRGVALRLEASDGRFRAHLLGPDGAVARSADVALTTGSHHFQYYWLTLDDGFFVQLPFVWMIADRRWLPVQDSFLQPDSPEPARPAIWNDSCIYCHTVGGAGRVSADGAYSAVAVGELGIACEACHGPSAEHAAAQQNPLTRYRLHLDDDARAAAVARPDRFDNRREVAVCGQCHGVFARTAMPAVNREADGFTVGDPLSETRQLILPVPDPTRPDRLLVPPAESPVPVTLVVGGAAHAMRAIGYDAAAIHLDGAAGDGPARLELGTLRLDGRARGRPGGVVFEVGGGPADLADALPRALGWRGQVPTAFDLGAFWADGTVRTTGRESNALARTACFTAGALSCGSCHRMHGAPPADQLAPGMDGDRACTGCHPDVDPATHSHHPAGSSGAACMSCHMPYTTFGLLTGIRSHRIDNPTAAMSARHGRPNACNLCHTDRTLAWTAEWLTRWYGQPAVAIEPPWDSRSAAALWALAGDGGQRAIAAAALGRNEARAVGGSSWTAPILARLLDDDYAAVRKVAADGLATHGLPPDYDFVGAPEARRAAARAVLDHWATTAPDRVGPAVLIEGPGRAEDGALDRLRAGRDRTPVTISE